MTDWAMNSAEPVGGQGLVVEIDESKFGKRKYHRGHYVEGQWIFGGIERDSGRIFLVPVEDRTSATLVGIIKTWIKPGSTIYSDCWKGYSCLEDNGYEHLTVNHSVNFVDPKSGAHTNGIESTWRHAKRFMPHYSRKKASYPGYLSHYMFLKQCRMKKNDPFDKILEEIGKIHFDPIEESLTGDEDNQDNSESDN